MQAQTRAHTRNETLFNEGNVDLLLFVIELIFCWPICKPNKSLIVLRPSLY